MHTQNAVKNVFVQLETSLNQLSDEQYMQPSKILFNASIGQHVRHIIELFICLDKGYATGIVNYDKRKRDTRIETEKAFAGKLLRSVYNNLDKPDKELVLETCYDEDAGETMPVLTNYYREIIYNLEHTVHHMALIRVGINEVSNIQLPQEYGVAASTIKYRKTTA
ncbi:MAG TPA: hypothetical protein VLD19_07940 [Chitinophagaceae bacterium]|nr:hypothetical protein [Chitinophagaceae bacterium]